MPKAFQPQDGAAPRCCRLCRACIQGRRDPLAIVGDFPHERGFVLDTGAGTPILGWGLFHPLHRPCLMVALP